jgi:hypothetical protein
MKHCSKCILTERAVPIGSDGVCLLCRLDDGTVKYKGEAALVELLERQRQVSRSRGSKYDCMITVSGGKDSMYALYALVKRYGIRPLAFNYSQGFVEPQASENLERGVRVLGVDLVRNTDNALQHRYLRHNIMSLSTARPSQRRLVGLLCTGCDSGYVDAAMRAAEEHGISLIVQGGCPVEPFLRGYLTNDVRLIANSPRISLILEELKEYIGNPGLFMNPRYPMNLRHMCYVKGLLNRFLPQRKSAHAIKRMHYFDYMPWNDEADTAELERELGWRRPPGRSVTMRFDCRLHVLVDRFRILYQGFSEKDAIFSAMVRKKMLTREQALDRAAREVAEDELLVDQVIQEVARTVGLEHRIGELRGLWHLAETPVPPPSR